MRLLGSGSSFSAQTCEGVTALNLLFKVAQGSSNLVGGGALKDTLQAPP